MIGLVGHPIHHSLSPFIHQQLHEVPYLLFENQPLSAVLKHPALQALNVTYPYKKEAFERCDLYDETAKQTGVVNTIVKQHDLFKGYNTDALALKAILETHGRQSNALKVSLLGNGATAQSALYALKTLGFNDVTVYARNPKEGQRSLQDLDPNTQLLINTTTVGMVGHASSFSFSLDTLKSLVWVIDVVNSPLRTSLILEAQERGIKTTTGLSMLTRQALLGAEKMLGRSFEHVHLDRLHQTVLKHTENIVFIGMPYSGKTTLAKAVAQHLGRPLIDLDERLAQSFKLSIPEVFDTLGEAAFREAETALIQDLHHLQGCVIATGGGAILNPQNVALLKRNGLLVWLQAPPPQSYLSSRPLSPTKASYDALKKDRWPRYQAVSNLRVQRHEDRLDTFNEWERVWHAYYDSQRP